MALIACIAVECATNKILTKLDELAADESPAEALEELRKFIEQMNKDAEAGYT